MVHLPQQGSEIMTSYLPQPDTTAASPLIPSRVAVRLGRFSTAVNPSFIVGFCLLLALILLLCAVSLGIGDYPLSPLEVIKVLLGDTSSPIENLVVWKLRMPRTLSALTVGLLLGIAGALTQSVTRNPLASPDILGITSGASVAAVSVIVLAPSANFFMWLSHGGLPLAALTGGLATGAIMWVLAWRHVTDPYQLVLVGIVLTALMQATILYLISRAEITDAQAATFWLHGSLGLASWERTIPAVIVAVLIIPVLRWLGFILSAITLGAELAQGLGRRFSLEQYKLLGVAIILTSVAVSAAGPVGLIAFVGPQIALRIFRCTTPPLLTSGLIAALLLLASDVMVQLLPTELPVGLVTSLLGGLFLIYILVSLNRRKGRA